MKFAALLISILFAALVGICLIIYFNLEPIKQQGTFKQKLQIIFTLDRKKTLFLIIPMILGILSFCLEYFLYEKDIIICFRWQLALMMMMPIGYIDFKEKIIPNKLLIIELLFTFPLLIVQIILKPDMAFPVITSSIAGGVVAGGIFLSTSLFVKNGIGAGDTKMYFVLGLLVGFVAIFNILLYSMVIGAVTGIVLIIIKKKNSKDSLALAPFTLVGVILAMLFGV